MSRAIEILRAFSLVVVCVVEILLLAIVLGAYAAFERVERLQERLVG